jgi:hypothetical protein
VFCCKFNPQSTILVRERAIYGHQWFASFCGVQHWQYKSRPNCTGCCQVQAVNVLGFVKLPSAEVLCSASPWALCKCQTPCILGELLHVDMFAHDKSGIAYRDREPTVRDRC